MKLNQQEKAIVEKIEKFSTPPLSILDVGCGKGAVISHCKSQLNIKVCGIDQHKQTVDDLIEKNIDAKVGDAREIPFPDEQFDWVLISNALHHIPNADKALTECFRVAKHGVIVSELWYDTTIKCQQLGAEIDSWCKKLHQALGFYHRVYLNAGEVISLIRQPNITSIEVRYGLDMVQTNLDYWLDHQKEYLEKLSANHVFLWELENLKAKMKNQSLCEPGWMIITLQK